MFTRKLLTASTRATMLRRLPAFACLASGRSLSDDAFREPAVTLFLDNKHVTLPFNTTGQTLEGFLGEINGHISNDTEHFDTVHNAGSGLQLDVTQGLSDIFAATPSIVISNENSNKQLVITKPGGGSLNPVNHQELMNLAEELNKRLSETSVTQQLKARAQELDLKIEPMHRDLLEIEIATNDTTDHSLLLFLSIWTSCTVGIARLTWCEFSWDIMEPVAWATQAGGMLFWGWYYFITRNENSMTDIAGRIRNKKLLRRLKKHNFDVKRYNELVAKRHDLDKQLVKLRSEF